MFNILDKGTSAVSGLVIEYDTAVDPVSVAGVHRLFNREEERKDYEKIFTEESLSNGGQPKKYTTGFGMAAKAKVDVLAGMERDFRARHMTRIRLMAHEAARRRGFHHDEGPLLEDMTRWVKGLEEIPEKFSAETAAETGSEIAENPPGVGAIEDPHFNFGGDS